MEKTSLENTSLLIKGNGFPLAREKKLQSFGSVHGHVLPFILKQNMDFDHMLLFPTPLEVRNYEFLLLTYDRLFPQV